MLIRAATDRDTPRIMEIRRIRTLWLHQRDTDQWSIGLTEDGFETRVRKSIDNGETWVVEDADSHVLGTIAVDTWANSHLWSPAELDSSLMLHRMITDPTSAGAGLGAVMLGHAVDLARQAGRPWLRLDAWTTNAALHRYYKAQGFRHVRNADHPVSQSTALFERQHGLTV